MIRAQKLIREEWQEIEVEGSEFEQRIVSLMLQAGTFIDSFDEDANKLKLEVLGEAIYLDLLNNKVQKLFFPEEIPQDGKKSKKTEKNKKVGSKKNQKKGKNDIYEKFMKSEKLKKIEDLFIEIVKANADSLFRQKNFGFSSNILEFKLISFLVLAKLLKDREEWIYEIIIGLKKCLQAYENYKGKLFFDEKNENVEGEVSLTLVKDIKFFLANLIEMNIFSMKITFIRYPKLVCHTIFDSYFESIRLKPYASQKEIIKSLRNYYKDKTNRTNPKGLLVFYKAMIGSGKTTVCLALAKLVKDLREYSGFQDLSVIFCCGLTQIRVQIGQLAFNSLKYEKGLTFAVATVGEDQKPRVIPHFSCHKITNPILIISDLETTLLLLKNPMKKYILFLDEPIIDADQEQSPMTEIFIQIMMHSPNLTILSSATLPNPENVPNLVGIFRNKYEDSEIMTISLEQAKIAQQIYINFSEKFYPHNGCKTIEELGIVLNSVRNNPFLARLYTGPSLYYFQDKLKKMNNMKLPSKGIEEKFGDPHNMSQKCIQEYAFELIETLLENGEDEQIAEFCQESKEEKFEMNNFKWEDLATKKAYLFIGGCLIATPSPLEFARKAFGQFATKVNFKALFKEYEKQKEVFLDKLKTFEEIKNEEVRLKEETKYKNENTPVLQFPEYMKINLKAHLLKYSNLEKPELVGFRKDFLLEDLVFKIDEDINLMLFSGVGIFESEKILNAEYNETIRNKAKYGELAYLISNKDILYGANYPLNTVIIDDDFVDIYSINTIFQTMGRAGRIGQAWKSNCFIGEKIKKKLTAFIRESNYNYSSIEATNIEKKIIKILYEKRNLDAVNYEMSDIISKMRKIAICFDANSIDGIFAMVSCVFYYIHKLQKIYKKNLSDIDFFQIIRLIPLDKLETIDALTRVQTVYFLGVFPLKLENAFETVKECKKIVFINRSNFNEQKFLEFSKLISWNPQIKIINVCDNMAACSLSYKYFKEKLVEKFSIMNFNPLFPSYVKKSPSQIFTLQMYEGIIKLISEFETNIESKILEKKAILSYMIDKASNYLNSYGNSLKTIWKISTLKIDKKLKISMRHSNIINKCNVLVDELIKIVTVPLSNEDNTVKGLVLYNVPSSYYQYKNIIKEIMRQKAQSLKVEKIIIISWISFKSKEELLLTVNSENSFNCDEFVKKYGGFGEKSDAECKILKKEFYSWKFTQVK